MAQQQLNRSQIRKSMRRQRNALSDLQLTAARDSLVKNLGMLPSLLKAKRVLSYIPLGGEISPFGLESVLHGAELFQPRITSFDKGIMRFYPARGKKTRNRFGIWEPAPVGSPLPAQFLDAVLVPLVAFDRAGNRLGMGAGFYDRAFATRLRHPHAKRPWLIGLAHHFQEVESLCAESWDVPLDAILTDRELIIVS